MDNKNSYKIEPIFPIGIYTVEIPEDLEKTFNIKEDENEFLDHDSENHYKTNGLTTEDFYLLNSKKYSKLKNFILTHCKNYGQNYLSIDSEKYIMSQSWITIKPPNTEHNRHIHPNSIISGVLYYGMYDEDIPGIEFYNSYNIWDFKYNRSLRINPNKQLNTNMFTANEVTFKFKTNTLILFPSWLEHGVPYNDTTKSRKSIAFNVLPQILGDGRSLTELKLK